MYISIWDVYKNIKKATCDYTKELSALSRQLLFLVLCNNSYKIRHQKYMTLFFYFSIKTLVLPTEYNVKSAQL